MSVIPQLVDSDKQTNDWMKIHNEFLPYLQFPLVQALQIGLPADVFYVFRGNEEWYKDEIIFSWQNLMRKITFSGWSKMMQALFQFSSLFLTI